MHCLSSRFLFHLDWNPEQPLWASFFCLQLCELNRCNQIKWKTGELVCTVEVELQTVRIDVVQGNVQLSGYVLHDAAEASWDEEHLDVALVQTVHELPEKKHGQTH